MNAEEVSEYFINIHNKNAENELNILMTKFNDCCIERLEIEEKYKNLFSALDQIEENNNNLRSMLKLQKRKDPRIKRLKKCGLYI